MIRLIERSSRKPQRLDDDAPLIVDNSGQNVNMDWTYFADCERAAKQLHYNDLRNEQQERTKQLMAIRLVPVTERKMPRSKVGKFTTLTDVQEALNALSKMPDGKSLEIEIEKSDYDRLKKEGTKDPARSIVNVLRRKFVTGGLNYKCYASDDRNITILKEETKKKK